MVPIAAVQNHFNVGERGHDDVVDYCEENGIVFVPYYPVKGDAPAALAQIAGGMTPPRSRSRLPGCFTARRSILPIPGTLSIEHLRENLARARHRAHGRRVRRACLEQRLAVRVGLQRDAVVLVAGAELIGGGALDGEALGGAAVELDVQLAGPRSSS